MKSYLFIASFVATLTAFSPVALGHQEADTPTAGKGCDLMNNLATLKVNENAAENKSNGNKAHEAIQIKDDSQT